MATSSDWVAQWNATQGAPGAAQASPSSDWVDEWKAAQAAPAKNTPASGSPTWRSLLFGPSETAAALGTGMIAQPLAGLAGLADAGARYFDKSLPSPADVVSGTENALTYQPRTQGGKLGTEIASYPFQKLAQGANWAGQKVASATDSPALGAATNTAIQALPMLLGAKVPALGEARVPQVPEIPEAVAQARSLGLKLTPTEANVPGGIVGRALESLTNSAKLERTISRKNAPVVTAAAAREVGIRGRVTPASIEAAYEPHQAVYDEVKGLGTIPTDATYMEAVKGQQAPGEGSFPKDVKPAVAALREAYAVPHFTGEDAVARIRQLRKEGNARVYGGKYDPDNAALGHAQLAVARALEDQIDRHLNGVASGTQEAVPSTGTPSATAQARADWMAQAKDLIPRYRAARQAMAKLSNFERAWRAGNEKQVSGLSLGKQLAKGAPLSGNLRTIAESAREFPRGFQEISKLRNTGPLSNLDFKIEGGLGAIHPLAALKAAPAFLAAPFARAILSSDLYQRSAFGPFKPPAAPSFPALLGASRALPLIAAGQNGSSLSQLLAHGLLSR